jgi:hypothetical protein
LSVLSIQDREEIGDRILSCLTLKVNKIPLNLPFSKVETDKGYAIIKPNNHR